MYNFTKSICLLAVTAVIVYAGYSLIPTTQKSVGGGSPYFVNTGVPTNGSSTVTATTGSTVAIATSTSRSYLRIQNDSIFPVYLSIGKAAVMGKGIYLQASSSVTFAGDYMFTASIFAISNATSNIVWISADN